MYHCALQTYRFSQLCGWIHRHIHHMSRTTFLILNFLHFEVYVVMTPIFPANQWRCASSSKKVAILSQKDKNDRKPFTITFHLHNHAVKSIVLNNFKLLRNDPETGRIFSQPPLILFKRDKNVGNFLVRSALKTNEQPGTFKCVRSRCKTCPFILNTSKISGYRDLSDLLRSPIVSHVPPQMSFIA